MQDGIYQVVHCSFTAGFVICDGRVTQCAPILRKRLKHWMTVAEKVGHASAVVQDANPPGRPAKVRQTN